MLRRFSSRRIRIFLHPTRIPSCIATPPAADLGGPIIKDKLFGFVSYQHLHISDQETGDELLDVPPGLNSGPAGGPNARGEANLMDSVNNNWTGNEGYSGVTVNSFNAASNPVGYALFTMPALLAEPGNYLIPSALPNANPNVYIAL